MADLTTYSDDTVVYLSGPVADPMEADEHDDDLDEIDVERVPRSGRRRRGARRAR